MNQPNAIDDADWLEWFVVYGLAFFAYVMTTTFGDSHYSYFWAMCFLIRSYNPIRQQAWTVLSSVAVAFSVLCLLVSILVLLYVVIGGLSGNTVFLMISLALGVCGVSLDKQARSRTGSSSYSNTTHVAFGACWLVGLLNVLVFRPVGLGLLTLQIAWLILSVQRQRKERMENPRNVEGISARVFLALIMILLAVTYLYTSAC